MGLIANFAPRFRAVEAGASPRPGQFGRTAGTPLGAGGLGVPRGPFAKGNSGDRQLVRQVPLSSFTGQVAPPLAHETAAAA